MKTTRWAAVAALALSGCYSVSGFYDKSALEEPLVNISGMWLAQGQNYLVVFRPAGGEATGEFTDLTIQGPQKSEIEDFIFTRTVTRLNSVPLKGELKGRVFLGETQLEPSTFLIVDGNEWYMNFSVVFQVQPDGRSGKMAFVTADKAWTSELRRISGDAPGTAPPAGRDPFLSACLPCALPVLASGAITGSPEPSAVTRDSVMGLGYWRNPRNELIPVRWCVPVEAPRRATFIPYPGAGFFSRTFDRGQLLAARAASPLHRKQAAAVDGKPAWWILNPCWEDGDGELAPSRLDAELYREDPDTGALPADVLEVARRAGDGPWKAVPAYVSGASVLLAARAVMEGGRPVRVETAEVKEPPLEDFLASKETDIPRARWRTRMLLDAKNLTLPRVLRESKTPELAALASKIEKLALDLNHEAELLRDSMQRSVEAGGTADEKSREISLVYKERIEVLKPILAAIKEEIANRQK